MTSCAQPNIILRTVPTFVSAHTFCASRKPWFKRARVDVAQSNKSPSTRLKLKFSYCDQINFNESVLKPGIPQ